MKPQSLILTLSLTLCSVAISAQDRDTIAGIPVNYKEDKVGNYREGLPDPLRFNDGRKVLNAADWTQRRAEILKIFEQNQFGAWPKENTPVRYSIREQSAEGLKVKTMHVSFSERKDGPAADVLIYLPKDASAPCPLLLNLSFMPNDKAFAPYVIQKFLAKGIGLATLRYSELEADKADGWMSGIRSLFPYTATDGEGGAISAWAWGVSRIIDCLSLQSDIDASKIALTGCSRLGKTTLWTAAKDPRIAIAIPSCSGEGGAAMSRRLFGETVAHIASPERYHYQFTPTYQKWGQDLKNMPMDAHMLLSLIAPRPLLLQTGSTDNWSDPKGEYISALEAAPVYRLLGKDAPSDPEFPKSEEPLFTTLGYVMHEGGHAVLPQDWDYYLEFLLKYF